MGSASTASAPPTLDEVNHPTRSCRVARARVRPRTDEAATRGTCAQTSSRSEGGVLARGRHPASLAFFLVVTGEICDGCSSATGSRVAVSAWALSAAADPSHAAVAIELVPALSDSHQGGLWLLVQASDRETVHYRRSVRSQGFRVRDMVDRGPEKTRTVRHQVGATNPRFPTGTVTVGAEVGTVKWQPSRLHQQECGVYFALCSEVHHGRRWDAVAANLGPATRRSTSAGTGSSS